MGGGSVACADVDDVDVGGGVAEIERFFKECKDWVKERVLSTRSTMGRVNECVVNNGLGE